MSRATVRSLFIGVFVLLVVQYGLVGIVGVYASEPWPAVVLPAFKSVYETSDTLRVEQTTIDVGFKNGGRTTVSPSRFLSILPRSHHASFLQEQCRTTSDSSVPPCATNTGRRWFFKRAQTLFPGQTVTSIKVIRTQMRFVVTSQSATTIPIDTLQLGSPSLE